ncbi:hypothetical protein [Paraburkholderia azotifigens]|uniref:hypothetical protein n=1 Tax=Paraburkholderia azotifigens TaxID=2057004 RepID=UPI0038B9D300
MPKSSLVSGGVTLGVTELVPAVEWAIGGFRGPAPASVASLIATVLVTGLHAAYNALDARSSAKPGQLTDNRQFASASILAPGVAAPSQPAQ